VVILVIAALLVTCAISYVFILVAFKAYNARKALELVTSRPQYSNQVVAFPHYVTECLWGSQQFRRKPCKIAYG
jgi:hypothetical protein